MSNYNRPIGREPSAAADKIMGDILRKRPIYPYEDTFDDPFVRQVEEENVDRIDEPNRPRREPSISWPKTPDDDYNYIPSRSKAACKPHLIVRCLKGENFRERLDQTLDMIYQYCPYVTNDIEFITEIWDEKEFQEVKKYFKYRMRRFSPYRDLGNNIYYNRSITSNYIEIRFYLRNGNTFVTEYYPNWR